ncbi:hypothetical protein Glove_396g61 [Diversispora epigaea]|uniref:Methyltransferase domain-containing protein n=1 Tax=Diversispora epigaea TaxID=1348612 RepID=A0A397H2A2_9GLOM|nr:hypothetical protein Glove_396g61 [Diversispora epigaea]
MIIADSNNSKNNNNLLSFILNKNKSQEKNSKLAIESISNNNNNNIYNNSNMSKQNNDNNNPSKEDNKNPGKIHFILKKKSLEKNSKSAIESINNNNNIYNNSNMSKQNNDNNNPSKEDNKNPGKIHFIRKKLSLPTFNNNNKGSSNDIKPIQQQTYSLPSISIIYDSNYSSIFSSNSSSSSSFTALSNTTSTSNFGNESHYPNYANIESGRLNLEHCLYRYQWQGNFSSPIEQQLKEGKMQVLNIGSGTYPWVMDMATQYPKCTFLGLDTLPIFLTEGQRLPNTGFMQSNVLNVIPFPNETFDFVSERFLMHESTNSEFRLLFNEMCRVLKPGG